MRPAEVLQKCSGEALNGMHAPRQRVLLKATEALISGGGRLTLIDLARAWPGAESIRAPFNALDRWPGNRHLPGGREHIHSAMNRWLMRSDQPTIVVDCPI